MIGRTGSSACIAWFAAFAALGVAATGHASERFQVRYNLAGALPGEMFMPAAGPGWLASIAYTHASIDKVTGDDGRALGLQVPGGTFPLPPPAPTALYPSYGASTVQTAITGTLRQWNLALAYLSHRYFGGGRVLVGLNLPYGTREQTTRLQGSTPALNHHPALTAPARAAAGAAFSTQYASTLAARAAAESGEVSGIGDAELHAAWIWVDRRLRASAATALVLPTGKWDPGAGADVGQGDFYTLRPSIQVGWRVNETVGIAGKLIVGLNSRNRDTDVRSGNWAGLEAAVGWRLPVGLVGLNVLRVQQVQDDSANPFGASRLRSTTAGLFYTAAVPAIGSSVTLQHAATVSSRNARHGHFTQLRLTHTF